MTKRRLGRSELFIEPLVLGTNVVGWTMDEATSFQVFDAYLDAGFNAIDTADSYSRWVPGNDSDSEKIIGRWMKARGNRDKVLIFTKVGSDMGQGHKDLSGKWIIEEVENSLRRLQTDYIDLYQSHWPDPNTPIAETLAAYDTLIRAGKVRTIGTSNQDAAMLAEALAVSKANGLPRYETLQNEYNLVTRDKFEGPVQDLCVAEQVSGIHYYGLASGFLTGKYRGPQDLGQSVRGEDIGDYFTPRGFALLDALDRVAKAHTATPAEVALAWVMAQPGITAPIASATKPAHVETFAHAAALRLTDEDMAVLNL